MALHTGQTGRAEVDGSGEDATLKHASVAAGHASSCCQKLQSLSKNRPFFLNSNLHLFEEQKIKREVNFGDSCVRKSLYKIDVKVATQGKLESVFSPRINNNLRRF